MEGIPKKELVYEKQDKNEWYNNQWTINLQKEWN